jgi:formylglycine-generating enzyme
LEKVAANAQQTPMGSTLQVAGHQGGQMIFYFREDETAEWEAALAANTRKAYSAFYNKYSKGNYGKLALEKLILVEEKEIWDKVPKSRTSALLLYIHENPDSPYLEEATELVDKLRSAKFSDPVEVKPVVNPSIIMPEIPGHMVFVKGGSFEMGDVFKDTFVKKKDRVLFFDYEEEIVHNAILNDFYISKYQLTFDEYDAFCKVTGRKLPKGQGWGRGQHPVVNVSWFDAVAYCNWYSSEKGLQQVYTFHKKTVTANWSANGYRLPTEAEWEYAAREGGRDCRFGNGKNIADPREINFSGLKNHKSSYSITGMYRGKAISVGSLNCPNSLGLHDMSGNVNEWCWDWHSKYILNDQSDNDIRGTITDILRTRMTEAVQPDNDIRGTITGYRKIARGGSYIEGPDMARVASRSKYSPSEIRYDTGFRLARTATDV